MINPKILINKKEFSLPIGEKKLSLLFPEENLMGVLEPKKLGVLNEEKVIIEALKNPIGTPKLREIVKEGEKVAIVVSDITRLWVRSNIFLPYLLKELNKGGVKDEDIFIILSNGAHRDQTPEETKLIVGRKIYKRVKVYNHHCQNKEEMVYLGKTSYNTPIWINKKVVEADRVVLTGGIVYHFLAGWGGGKKSICPGVTSFETIMSNHRLGLHPDEGKGLNPKVCAGKMKGNPLSEDMIEIANVVNPDFILNVVVNTQGRIAKAVAGDMIKAHKRGCEMVKKYFEVKIKEKADLVIASCGGYPKDINFYQSYKALYNVEKAVKRGGVIILLTESREGIGNENFYSIFTDFKNRAQREKFLRENYEIGKHMGFHTSLIAENHKIIVISNLPDKAVENMNMLPAKNINEALNIAQGILGKNPLTYIIPHGSITSPIF